MGKRRHFILVSLLVLLSIVHIAVCGHTSALSDSRDVVRNTNTLHLRQSRKSFVQISQEALDDADDELDSEDHIWGDRGGSGGGGDNDGGGSGGSNPAPAPAPSPPSSGGDSGGSGSSSTTVEDSSAWYWFLVFLGPLGIYLYCRFKDRCGSIKVIPSEGIIGEGRNMRLRHRMPSFTALSTTRHSSQHAQGSSTTSSVAVRAKTPTPRATMVHDSATPSTPGTISFSPDIHYVDTVVFVPTAILEE